MRLAWSQRPLPNDSPRRKTPYKRLVYITRSAVGYQLDRKKEKCIAPFCVRFALQDYYVFASLSLLDHNYYYHRITVTGARSQENEQHSSEQKAMVLFLSFADRYLTQHLADSRLLSFLSITNNFSARRSSRRQNLRSAVSTKELYTRIYIYIFFCLEFVKLGRAVVVVHASPSCGSKFQAACSGCGNTALLLRFWDADCTFCLLSLTFGCRFYVLMHVFKVWKVSEI